MSITFGVLHEGVIWMKDCHVLNDFELVAEDANLIFIIEVCWTQLSVVIKQHRSVGRGAIYVHVVKGAGLNN